MSNDHFNKYLSTYLKIQEEMDRLQRMAEPSYLNVYEQMERSFEPIRQMHFEITQALKAQSIVPSEIDDLLRANQHWQDLIDQAMAPNRVLDDLRSTHQSWLDAVKPENDIVDQLQATASLSLGNVAYRLTVTEQLFAGIELETLKDRYALPEPIFLNMQEAIGGVTSTYQNLANSINSFSELTLLPDFTFTGATRELFTTSYALDEICVSDEHERERETSELQLIVEIKEETSVCIGLLKEVDPALAQPYLGAHDALRGNSADRARHILSSLRELWNHLLRRLAPDDVVLSWIPVDGKQLLHEGRPTRKARVLYVCRNVNHTPLNDFVLNDTKALIQLFDVFHRVHELESELTDDQLRALLLKTDSWLTYILQIWKGTR